MELIIAPQNDGTLKAQASLDLYRTLWGVCYGSGRLYERLGMHLVNDLTVSSCSLSPGRRSERERVRDE